VQRLNCCNREYTSTMASEIPTLDELAQITGQTREQLARDIRAAANPRDEMSDEKSATADD